MSKKKSGIISLVLFLFLLTYGSLVYSASEETVTRPLRGLTAIFILVEDIDPDIQGKGEITKEQIQTDVELKLRMAEIKVVSKEEYFKIPGKPFLYVNLNAIKNSTVTYIVYHINISLNQEVYLERDSKTNVYANTWDKHAIGLIRENKVDRIRDHIKDLVDIFINDFLSVNPKRGK